MGSTSQQVDAALDLCNRYSGDLNNCQRSEFVDEQPQSTLDTNAFWIMETEVTNVQFAAFIDANGYDQQQYWTAASWAWRTENNIAEPRYWGDPDWNQPDYPIVGISWYEAIAYSAWLAEQSGLAMRLPTEGEWEKASRGEDGRQYPWGNDWDGSKLNFCDSNCEFAWKDQESNDGFATTAPVKSYSTGKGPYNAYGMAGNVWEWTTTIYDTARYPYPYQADDRELLDGGARRVLRGGSWSSQPFSVRAANRPSRGGYMPDGRYFDVGVRLVVSPSN
jgi:formylglycine-generating enzyme required for sulfatase activity